MRHRQLCGVLIGAAALAVGSLRPALASVPQLPAGWTAEDIGGPDPAGSSSFDDKTGTWTILGSGGDIEGTSDQFQFAYQTITGDATITAHFVSMVQGDYPWTKVGPMIRVDNTDGAQNVTMNMTAGVGVRIQGRDDAFANTQDNIPPVLSLSEPQPVWLRLERIGKNVAAFYSPDGKFWSWGGATMTLSDLKDQALIGLAVTSHQQGTLATGVFDHVSIQSGPQLVYGLQNCNAAKGVTLSWQSLPGAVSYNVYRAAAGETDLSKYTKLNDQAVTGTSFADTSSTLENNQQYTYLVSPVSKDASGNAVEGDRAAIQASPYVPLTPAGFVATDINEDPDKALDFNGGCTPPLGAFYDPNTDTITLRGAGGDGIGGTADTFNFTNKEVTGDFQVSAKALTRPLRTASTAKAGLMIREGLATGAREADLVLTASQNGLVFEWRDTTDAAGTQAPNPLITPEKLAPPIWIRLTRKGDAITAEYSTDGTTWQGGTDPNNQATIKGLTAKVNVGLAITSNNTPDSGRAITQATFQNLAITQ
jgi:regulation of enolase protein 1 (concanavalin A-like superfamily)